MVYRSCKHRVYPNQKQEKLFRQYLGNSRFIHNNIIGEIEYNRRIANLFNVRSPYVNRSYVESIFNYLRVWYPLLMIQTLIQCNHAINQCSWPMITFSNDDSDIQNLKKSTNPHNQ